MSAAHGLKAGAQDRKASGRHGGYELICAPALANVIEDLTSAVFLNTGHSGNYPHNASEPDSLR